MDAADKDALETEVVEYLRRARGHAPAYVLNERENRATHGWSHAVFAAKVDTLRAYFRDQPRKPSDPMCVVEWADGRNERIDRLETEDDA